MQSVKTAHHVKSSYQRQGKASREGQEKGARRTEGKKREACGRVGESFKAVQVIRPYFYKSNRPKRILALKATKYIYKHN